ncbi:3-oxoacyl-[acyl-carrier protein] reductase [Roseivivax halotolerans]|uniref:3-oxoacyl-[acyl-carrier protein] reductase n=1 Tax=Roseivivax halotolerans TaxID=93684 RepID=A0A1I5WLJ0_9RHOB|nr:SDR family oxidoreductase [Roseivivax halotolerans]SFQ20644.1 3-oxoacyl-[acyl-carrier protein] reductase [Roseivivax halotolerans]
MTDRQIALVTGATSGIGWAVALELARRGWQVVGVGRAQDRLAALAQALDGAGPGLGHVTQAADVSKAGDMDGIAALMREIGQVDLLVASAVYGRESADSLPPRTHDLSLAEWQKSIDVNLHGVVLADHAVLPLMREAGFGDIVHIGSSITPHGMKGQALAPAYCATKFALAALGREMARELEDEGIVVRTIFPGTVETPLIEGTALAGPFGGTMSPESFAVALVGLIELGLEMALPDPHLLPMPRARAAQT